MENAILKTISLTSEAIKENGTTTENGIFELAKSYANLSCLSCGIFDKDLELKIAIITTNYISLQSQIAKYLEEENNDFCWESIVKGFIANNFEHNILMQEMGLATR